MKTEKLYQVKGVLQFQVPIDIDFTVQAYSLKQAVFKAFIEILQKQKFIGYDRKQLYKKIRRELHFYEQ